MIVKNEEITKCSLNNEELMILCEARDLITSIRLYLRKREFGNTWNSETLKALADDINLLMLKCCLEDRG